MSISQKYVVATSLSVLLLAGNVLLPLTHYVWMAAGDYFGESGPIHHSASADALPAEHVSLKHYPAESSSPNLNVAKVICDYSTTITHDGALEVEPLYGSILPRRTVNNDWLFEDSPRSAQTRLLPLLRGPPSVA